MNFNAQIKELVEISHGIGNRNDYAQGGGGNSSVKLNDTLMAVKASGYLLSEMTEHKGYAVVDYHNISKNLKPESLSEEEVTRLIVGEAVDYNRMPKLKPSIETGFHALIKATHIIHSHSVYANILNCSIEGEEIARKLFPALTWVAYGNPGKDLLLKFKQAVENQGEAAIIFLANHGVFTTGSSTSEVLENHENANRKICKYFGIRENFDENSCPKDMDFVKSHALFPDQIVYVMDEALKATKAAKQTLAAYQFIYNTIMDLGLTPQFIPQDKMDVIMNMESEKYRKTLVV